MRQEKEIEISILQWLNASGCFAWKNDTEGWYDTKKEMFRKRTHPFSLVGVSDISCILPDGKYMAIEVKTPQRKSKATLDQKHFLKLVQDKGGIACIASCIEDVSDTLQKHFYIIT